MFCTLTFPGKVSQKYANECFSKFVENLTKNYKLNSYVSVKENHKSGNPHFHCLFDIPFVNFSTLNKSWNSTFSDRLHYSRNAFTTGKRRFAADVRQVASYITKYITKSESKDQLIETRLYFISENVLSRPELIDENTLIYLTTKFANKFFSTDHFSIYMLINFSCLPEYYNMHRRRPKKEKKPKKIPDSLQANLTF